MGPCLRRGDARKSHERYGMLQGGVIPAKAVMGINQNEVIPAQAGIHVSAVNAFASSANFYTTLLRWAPASAGATLERRMNDTLCFSVASYLRRQ